MTEWFDAKNRIDRSQTNSPIAMNVDGSEGPSNQSNGTDGTEEQGSVMPALTAILAPADCLVSASQCMKFAKLMNSQKSDANREPMLSALFKTYNQDVLINFAKSKGIMVLRSWLVQSRDTSTGLLKLMLQVLEKLPMTLDILKREKLGKLMKAFAKGEGASDTQETQSMAQNIIESWTKLIECTRY